MRRQSVIFFSISHPSSFPCGRSNMPNLTLRTGEGLQRSHIIISHRALFCGLHGLEIVTVRSSSRKVVARVAVKAHKIPRVDLFLLSTCSVCPAERLATSSRVLYHCSSDGCWRRQSCRVANTEIASFRWIYLQRSTSSCLQGTCQHHTYIQEDKGSLSVKSAIFHRWRTEIWGSFNFFSWFVWAVKILNGWNKYRPRWDHDTTHKSWSCNFAEMK